MDEEPENNGRYRGTLGPLILIIVGTVFLLEKLGFIGRDVLSQWWPLLLIFIGAWLLVSRISRNKD